MGKWDKIKVGDFLLVTKEESGLHFNYPRLQKVIGIELYEDGELCLDTTNLSLISDYDGDDFEFAQNLHHLLWSTNE